MKLEKWLFFADMPQLLQSMNQQKIEEATSFVEDLIDKIEKLTGFKHKITSAYHPQSNDLDERFNQTLKPSSRSW